MRHLRDYQREAIIDLIKRWDAGATRVPQVLATGLGKGHPLDTDVPTPSGLRKWGDLKVGDRIFGRNGLPTEVTAVFDRGVLPTYRVTFSDRSSVRVDGDHLWSVVDAERKGRLNEKTRRRLSTAEIMRLGLRPKNDRGWRWHIPLASVERRQQDFTLDPYVVGALIANGCMTSKYDTTLTTPDPDVAKLVDLATESGCVKINDSDPSVCDRYYLPGLVAVTGWLGLRVPSAEKRIPRAYLEASREQRIGLLHGLMDADGSSRDQTRRSVTYHTTSPGLGYDICELVTSLGGTASVREYVRASEGKPTEYQVGILLPSSISAFGTTRKAHGEWSMRNLQPKRAIVSIERVADAEIRCITVDAPDHLYLITRSHIVTHNTEIFTALESRWIDDNQGVQRAPGLATAWIPPLHRKYGLGRRVLVLAHTDELIEQAARKARQRNPHLTVGIVKAGLNEAHAQIVVSSRQTLQSAKRREGIRNVGLIIVDEAHHALRSNTYGKILEHFGAWPDVTYGETIKCKVAGFTATLARGDKGKLSSVWEECTFRRDILFGIRHGYLLDVRGERVVVPDFDLTKVKRVAGDFSDSSLADELERTFAPQRIAEKYMEHAQQTPCAECIEANEQTSSDVGYAVTGNYCPNAYCSTNSPKLRQGIAFWPLVETAYHGAAAFESAGIPSAVIHGGLPKEERRLILKRFAAGEITVVHNCMVLTEGFDAPWADVVVIARPTQSAALYQQMVGRVLRPDLTVPAEQRGKALILDVVGAARQHDLRSLIDLSPERKLAQPDGDADQLSLLELDDWAIQDEERRQSAAVFDDPTAEQWTGETATVAFDPLHREKVWAQTPDRVFYMSAGTDQYVFLSESWAGEPGTWDVVWCSKLGPLTWPRVAGAQGLTQYVGLPLEEALLCAEDVALERGGYGTKTLTSRKAAWRKVPPTVNQLNAARAAGIKVPMKDGFMDLLVTPETSAWTKGELSEALDAHKAARRIDPLVRLVKASAPGGTS